MFYSAAVLVKVYNSTTTLFYQQDRNGIISWWWSWFGWKTIRFNIILVRKSFYIRCGLSFLIQCTFRSSSKMCRLVNVLKVAYPIKESEEKKRWTNDINTCVWVYWLSYFVHNFLTIWFLKLDRSGILYINIMRTLSWRSVFCFPALSVRCLQYFSVRIVLKYEL